MNFTCPYCNQITTITAPNHDLRANDIFTDNSEHGFIGLKHNAVSCPNQECKKLSLSVSLIRYAESRDYLHRGGHVLKKWHLLPASQAKPQPNYIPDAITKNYIEACSILNLSPNASATLSRRCLQGIVRHFWNIPENKRGNLGAELSFIKDQVDSDTWDGIDAIRSVGDIGAHMEKDVDYVVEVEDDEAELLIELIEMLFLDWYVARHKRQERARKAKELSQAKLKQKKDAKQASSKSKETAADSTDT